MRYNRSTLRCLSKACHLKKRNISSHFNAFQEEAYLTSFTCHSLVSGPIGPRRCFATYHRHFQQQKIFAASPTPVRVIPGESPYSDITKTDLGEVGKIHEQPTILSGESKQSETRPEACEEDAPKVGTTSQDGTIAFQNHAHNALTNSSALSGVNGNPEIKETQSTVEDPQSNITTCATQSTDESNLLLDDKNHFSPEKVTLSYSSLKQYCRRMATLLFLEEESSLNSEQALLFKTPSFRIDRRAHPKYKDCGFYLDILVTPALLGRFMLNPQTEEGDSSESDSSDSSGSETSDSSLEGRTVVLVSENSQFWFGCMIKIPKAEKSDNGYMRVYVRLYPWGPKRPPNHVDKKDLKLMIVSSQVNTMFKAISRLGKSPFHEFVLGKAAIQHSKVKTIISDSDHKLNVSQKSAVKSVLKKSVTVVKGPPGTGKTSTIHEMIMQLIKRETFPIVVVAASNIAVDNIAEKMISEHSKSILRMTARSKELEYSRGHHLAPVCFHTRFYDASPPDLQELIKAVQDDPFSVSQKKHKRLKKARNVFLKKELSERQVIFCTTMSAAALFLEKPVNFPVIIMDEATQSSEPATLIPFTLPGVKKIVLVGDQKQLSCFTNVKGLSMSLFERVLRNGSFKSSQMLDTQYRMHPQISAFPRKEIYRDRLLDGITAAEREMVGIPKNPVLFWDTGGTCPEETVLLEERQDANPTKSNFGEARYVEQVVTHLIQEKNIKKSSVGVITPYRGQRNQICSVLMSNRQINPQNELPSVEVDSDEFSDHSKRSTIQYVSGVMIASVDAFQGREKDFIVMSCVRSNPLNQLGFLNDRRRLNVALTRAKYGLIIVGDLECLRNGGTFWSKYVDFLEKSGSVLRSSKFEYR